MYMNEQNILKDSWMDEKISWRKAGWMEIYLIGQPDGWMERYLKGQLDGWIDIVKDSWMIQKFCWSFESCFFNMEQLRNIFPQKSISVRSWNIHYIAREKKEKPWNEHLWTFSTDVPFCFKSLNYILFLLGSKGTYFYRGRSLLPLLLVQFSPQN